MNNCTVQVTGYSGDYTHFNGIRQTRITKADIAWGLLTLGKSHWLQYFSSPFVTLNDFIHNYTGLNTYLTEAPELMWTTRFETLDASDKRIKSYNVGMGIGKVVADRILSVPYLLHIDSLVNAGKASLTEGDLERGDLAGMDHKKAWHVLEAKGPSRSASTKELEKTKRQATKVTEIDGKVPKTRSSCLACIKDSGTTVLLSDPEGEATVRLQTAELDVIKFYYDRLFQPHYEPKITRAGQARITRHGLDFRILRLNKHLRYGVLENVFDSLQQGNIDFLDYLIEAQDTLKSSVDGSFKESVGTDGIILLDNIQ